MCLITGQFAGLISTGQVGSEFDLEKIAEKSKNVRILDFGFTNICKAQRREPTYSIKTGTF